MTDWLGETIITIIIINKKTKPTTPTVYIALVPCGLLFPICKHYWVVGITQWYFATAL